MQPLSPRCIRLLSGLILFFSFLIILINNFVYRFPGNNYFPENVPSLVIFLILLNLGLKYCFAKNSKPSRIGRELLYFIAVMSLIALATNAIQLTPFAPVDKHIVTLEAKMDIHMNAIITWTNNYPLFQSLLSYIYDSLPYQMSILPLLVIFTCRLHLLREYYFLLLCTTLFGFGFYYFFPTTAPASIIHSPLFSENQLATGLKFLQIHHYIEPTTNEGGLIALPSFHVIWAVMCVFLIREWIIPCTVLAIINILLIASCVLLGWHYCTDVVGSFILLWISFYFFKRCSKQAIK